MKWTLNDLHYFKIKLQWTRVVEYHAEDGHVSFYKRIEWVILTPLEFVGLQSKPALLIQHEFDNLLYTIPQCVWNKSSDKNWYKKIIAINKSRICLVWNFQGENFFNCQTVLMNYVFIWKKLNLSCNIDLKISMILY